MKRLPSKSLEGRKVRLIHCNDPHTVLVPGLEGIVDLVDDLGTVHVKWDNGRSLGLVWDDGDRWEVLPKT